MEDLIEDYTRYIYITFGVVSFILIVSTVLFIVVLIRKNNKTKIKENEFVNKMQSIKSSNCPSCNRDIDGDSIYCKYCGNVIKQ